MNKRYSVLFSLAALFTASLACNFYQAGPTPDINAALTQAVLTIQAQTPNTSTATQTAASSDTPIAPTETGTISPSPTLGIPMVSVSVDTNCRTGPGTVYDLVGGLKVGKKAEVVGKFQNGAYWVIKNPTGSGTCWLWGKYALVEGDLSKLPEMTAPPTPTPTQTFTPTPSLTATQTPTWTLPPPAVLSDLVVEEFFQSTMGEIVIRVAVLPSGTLSGSFQYRVFAGGVQVKQSTCPVPAGSAACWTGYIVSGTQSIQVQIDTANAFTEPNEANNALTLTCNFVSKACY